VSRQACQVVSTLASVMGTRFEQVALQLVPQLFKMVVITVQVRVLTGIHGTSAFLCWSRHCVSATIYIALQVIAESSEAAVAAVVRSCRGQQLVGKLCDALCRDRSAKLRLCCADWLLQVDLFTEPTLSSFPDLHCLHRTPLSEQGFVADILLSVSVHVGRTQVLEEWDDAALERSLGHIPPAVQAACGDAVGEVRNMPRSYLKTASWPCGAPLAQRAS